MMKYLRKILAGILAGLCVLSAATARADYASEALTYMDNFEKNDKQMVLVGEIDSLTIVRGPVRFHLGKGRLTIFDFGFEKPSAFYFKGDCQFSYTPPDEIETRQLQKFTKKSTFDLDLKDIFIFYSVPLELPHLSGFAREQLDKDLWRYFSDVHRDAFYYTGIYIANKLLADLVSDGDGTFFYADFRYKKYAQYAFIEGPFASDYYRLLKLRNEHGRPTYDVYGSFTPSGIVPPSWRYFPKAIDHYDISAVIDGNGDMTVNCRINYRPLRAGRRFFYFNWFNENEPIAAYDSQGQPIQIITRNESFRLFEKDTEENGFGVVLNDATIENAEDYIDIEYKCGAVKDVLARYFSTGKTDWYPKNVLRESSTYDVTFDCPENMPVIMGGNMIESHSENGRLVQKWEMNYPAEDMPFAIGSYGLIDINNSDIYPVKIYYIYRDMARDVAADVANSLNFFAPILGPAPFDTIKVVETMGNFSRSAAGLIYLSTLSFTDDEAPESKQYYRAAQVAMQWWRHKAGFHDYHDWWIVQGLSRYCGLHYHEMAAKSMAALLDELEQQRRLIFSGEGGGSMGSAAGSVTLAGRLNSSLSKDYESVIEMKSTYIIHMIRFMLHDFTTGSDEQFYDLLKELAYAGTLTNDKLQKALEARLGDMSWFFNQWVYGIDIPTYKFSYDTRKNGEGKYIVTCHVVQKDVPENFIMVVPITVVFSDDQYAPLKIWIDKPENDIELPPLPMEPKKIEFNTYDAVLCRVE